MCDLLCRVMPGNAKRWRHLPCRARPSRLIGRKGYAPRQPRWLDKPACPEPAFATTSPAEASSYLQGSSQQRGSYSGELVVHAPGAALEQRRCAGLNRKLMRRRFALSRVPQTDMRNRGQLVARLARGSRALAWAQLQVRKSCASGGSQAQILQWLPARSSWRRTILSGDACWRLALTDTNACSAALQPPVLVSPAACICGQFLRPAAASSSACYLVTGGLEADANMRWHSAQLRSPPVLYASTTRCPF